MHFVTEKSSTFAAENLVSVMSNLDMGRIKRESGETPEQTRCCISPFSHHAFSVTVIK